jgi:hypothetical protein
MLVGLRPGLSSVVPTGLDLEMVVLARIRSAILFAEGSARVFRMFGSGHWQLQLQ